jgi:hypothetical protein
VGAVSDDSDDVIDVGPVPLDAGVVLVLQVVAGPAPQVREQSWFHGKRGHAHVYA